MFISRSRKPFAVAASRSHWDLLGAFLGEPLRNHRSTVYPAFNVWINADGAIIASELPGVKLEALEITASGKTVTIAGNREGVKGEATEYLRRERPSGEFKRAIELPFQIDAGAVEAKLTHGVLQINLPRSMQDKPRRISVHAG